MADGLTVSGGGVTKVSTEEMASQASNLKLFSGFVGALRGQLCMLLQAGSPAVLVNFDAPISAAKANAAIDDAVVALSGLSGQAELLASMLELAAQGYGLAEHLADAAAKQAAASFAYGLGRIYPVLLTWLTPTAIGAAGAWLLTPQERREEALGWLESNSAALADPRVVDLVRLSVMSADEFGAGALHVPHELLGLLGDEALGVIGLSPSVAVITSTARRFGLLGETPVTVSKTSSSSAVTPAAGFEDRAKRIPQGSSQIRIDRYEIAGQPDRFEVYIGGTRDGSPLATGEPFDMTSNLTAMSMGDAGSTRAVQLAMTEAGITADTPVQFTGYSQGAIIAVELADSGQYDTHGIFTVGGPTGQLDVPDEAPYLALEHEEDIVTAMGGSHKDLDTVLVRRAIFEGTGVPSTSHLPAHELARYIDSAALLDSATESRIVGVSADMADFTSGATSVESTEWKAKRDQSEASTRGRTSGGRF